MKQFVVSLFFLFVIAGIKDSGAQICFGVYADCQYCDCKTHGTRYYRNSLDKLSECIFYFNQIDAIEFVINLGDLIDRDFESFIVLKPIMEQSTKPIFHVIGNHDLKVEAAKLNKVPKMLGLKNEYYSFKREGWLFVFTNGNDITFHSENPEVVKQAKGITSKLKEMGKPNYHPWNGGMGDEQLKWLDYQLNDAETSNLKVAIFSHYPLLPMGPHTLWNQEKVISILQKYSCVKLWMNGHNHKGNYSTWQGIHFITMKGMVETETENAFAEVFLSGDSIKIKGFGMGNDYVLKIN